MGIITWVILGALAGWVASLIAGGEVEQSWLNNTVVGIIGALIGGFVFNLLGGVGIVGFTIWSLVVAVIGAVVLLSTHQLFRRPIH